ncbi:gamma-glutamylcyclotransferase family protein [Paenibacillus rigui]|uniref:Gamma-glutamylcyclotransferase n=1 Tax=Paenibacillus rigui TaxID=554312 RepID=A0A229UPK8_9BACL|nr:gamma-glutamylcyclotransferase family protein [Paenibacillus rigui]OXM85313.1 gamma-glutamylcyclotransferase [Paenibacillus rigui]
MIWVFVYGTLLVGEMNHQVAEPYVMKVEGGKVRGRLVDYGPYPALVPTVEDEWVRGEWLLVTEPGLEQMDMLEEYYGPEGCNDYERVWIRDAERQEREGWVYIWTDARGCSPIPGGCWRTYLRNKKA